MRDDFSKAIVRILSDRVNSICSNPNCRASTRGPRTETHKAINIGKAAHITAASPDGPRYDPKLTKTERSHFSNGIWLCSTCADLIDTDPLRFTVELLNEWKEKAEKEAFKEIGRPKAISKGRYALVSSVKRFGAESSALVGDHVIPLVYSADTTDPQSVPTWFISGAYVAQFKIQKRKKFKHIIFDELRVTVHKRVEIPQYRSLYGAYPAETSLYTVVIDSTKDGHLRTFPAERFYEVTEPRHCKEQRFIPLVLDDEIPHTVSVRIDAITPGLYYVSIEALMSRGMNQECHTVMGPSPIIFEKQPEPVH